jgi:hypothetical protein
VNVSLQPGEPFNPYRMFNGVFIPEGLMRCPWINPGAKLAWGRLARYAGEDGRCYPTVKTRWLAPISDSVCRRLRTKKAIACRQSTSPL